MPLILCVLDGWGHRASSENNAILQARTPFLDNLLAHSPHTLIHAAEEYVGLPKMCMGNSEVGHMGMGAGRVLFQDLLKIDKSVEDGSLKKHTILKNLAQSMAKTKGTCHVLGLLSDGFVHSSHQHMLALANIMKGHNVPVSIHAILDGRDTGQKVASKYIEFLESRGVQVQTLIGRYYAMDRDKRWDRTKLAYSLFTKGEGQRMESPAEALKLAYKEHCDEFCPPFALPLYKGMKEGDSLIMTNFRADRMRQILALFLGLEENFAPFPLGHQIVTMTSYSDDMKTQVLFPKEKIQNTLGEVLSKHGKKQLRISETEKYAHITFFFNGGREKPFLNEDRILIPSPQVSSYDLTPKMSADEVTKALVQAIKAQEHNFILVNYANADMVGHTGNFQACIQAVEFLDKCLKRVHEATMKVSGRMIVTADHGNAEEMAQKGELNKAHTINRVPFVISGENTDKIRLRSGGALCNVASTVLEMIGLEPPEEMDESLLEN